MKQLAYTSVAEQQKIFFYIFAAQLCSPIFIERFKTLLRQGKY